MKLTLHNSLSGKKELFEPHDPEHVTMYVCGPTVYDKPHIGNARAVVVYDVLYRLLKHLAKQGVWDGGKGNTKVTYVRNITDVDDKINAAAKANNEPISALTARITKGFHEDMAALGNQPPDIEPRATEHIGDMIAMIGQLIENGNAYVSAGHVLFSVKSTPLPTSPRKQREGYYYGKLSGRKLEDLNAGARVEVEGYKREPGDFVLWKPADAEDDPSSVFDSPWGKGRPGWHIECSAMSTKYLGRDFDIHGGGADLKFPHHENEIAQSCCAYKGSHFARYWVHNGFLTVNGEKMAKSAGNFITVRELLEQGIPGEVIRYVLLSTKYNEPLDWSDKRVEDARKILDARYRMYQNSLDSEGEVSKEFIKILAEDINTPKALAWLLHTDSGFVAEDVATLRFLGLLQSSYEEWFKGGTDIDEQKINTLIEKRNAAKLQKDWKTADGIRDELTNMGIVLEDSPSGTIWRRK